MSDTRRNAKNWALFAVLMVLVIILFAITLLRYDGARISG